MTDSALTADRNAGQDRPLQVLVIDDDSDIVELVSLCVTTRWPDANVIAAASGKDGLSLAEAVAHDIVLLDIGLPDIDGLEVLRRLRRASEVPVVMVSGRSKDVDVARFLMDGADDYVIKPFSQIELIARIEAILRRAGARDSLTWRGPPEEPTAATDVEQLYEGTVRLLVQAEGSMARLVHFLHQLRSSPDFRIVRLANNRIGGVDIWLEIRQPVDLQASLGEIAGVVDVSSTRGRDPREDEPHLTVTLGARLQT